MTDEKPEPVHPGRIAALGVGAMVLGFGLTLGLAVDAGVTGYLVPMLLVAALAGGLLAWLNELVEDGKASQRVALLVLAAVGVFLAVARSSGRQVGVGLLVFATGVAGVVVAAHRQQRLEAAQEQDRPG